VTVSLTWRQALAWRMRRHGLVDRPFAGSAEVASALCGLHAQVGSSADLTAFVRGAAPSRSGLVKTWAVRGTLHLLPVAELGVWQSAMSTYEHFLKGAWVRAFGFASADDVEALIRAVGDALDGRTLTREELAGALPEYREKIAESWGSALKPAAFRGLLDDAGAEPVGKRLGFLLQEMLREANTTGSKANDAGMLVEVVLVKEELERVREQVENVE